MKTKIFSVLLALIILPCLTLLTGCNPSDVVLHLSYKSVTNDNVDTTMNENGLYYSEAVYAHKDYIVEYDFNISAFADGRIDDLGNNHTVSWQFYLIDQEGLNDLITYKTNPAVFQEKYADLWGQYKTGHEQDSANPEQYSPFDILIQKNHAFIIGTNSEVASISIKQLDGTDMYEKGDVGDRTFPGVFQDMMDMKYKIEITALKDIDNLILYAEEY